MFKNISAFFGYALLVILCVAGITALSAYGFHLVDKYDRWDLLEPAISIGLFVVAGVVFSGIVFISAQLLKLLGKHINLFGTSPFGVLISLGVTALFFKNALYSCITFPFHSIYLLIRVIRNTLGMIASRNTEGGTAHTLRSWIEQVQMMLQYFLGEFNESIVRMFADFPWAGIIQALAFWAVAGVVLNSFLVPKSPDTGKPSAVIDFFSRLGINRLLLTIVIFVSLYLCATCIIAIPWLTENKADLSEDDTMVSSIRQRAERFIQPDTNVYLLQLRSADSIGYYAASFNRLDSLIKANGLSNDLEDDLESVRLKLSVTRKQTDQLKNTGLESWNESVQLAKKEKKQASITAEDYFRTRMFESGKREKKRYLIRLLGWIDARYEFIEVQLSKKKATLQQLDDQLMRKIIRGADAIEFCREELERSIVPSADSLMPVGQNSGTSDSARIDNCRHALKNLYAWDVTDYVPMEAIGTDQEPDWSPKHPPEPVELADGMGIFSVLSGWLLKVRSFELTLITGMFGFGLLGACLSFFVIPERRSIFTTSTFWIGEAILQGLSASIVVFLAVKGGLVIIAADATQPNAYLLFFICLAGAVFSFKVWEWARAWFEKLFKGEGKTVPEGVMAPQMAVSGSPGSDVASVENKKKEGD